MKNKLENNSLKITWLLSYIFVIIIPIVFSLFVYFEYNRTLTDQTKEFNDYTLKSTTMNVTNILSDIKTLRYEISFDDYLEDFLAIKNPSDYYSPESYRFINDVRTYYGATLSTLDFYYIYINETDMVLSGSGLLPSRTFYDIYFDDADFSYDDWMIFLSHAKSEDYVTTRMNLENGTKDTLSSAIPLPVSPSRVRDMGTLVISVAKDKFFYGMNDVNFINQCDMFIFDTNGKNILSKTSSDETIPPASLSGIKSRRGYTMISDYISLDATSWTIISFLPRKAVFARIIYMRKFTVASIIICLILLFFAVRSLLIRNYRPVKKLMDILPDSNETNEYKAISKSIEQTLADNKMLSKNIEKQNLELRDATLVRFLKSSSSYLCDDETLKKYEIRFTGNVFNVCAFYVQDIDELFKDDDALYNGERYSLMKFILSNIVEELFLTERSCAYVTENNGLFIAVINHDGQIQGTTDYLIEKLSFATEFIGEQFGVNINFAISTCQAKANISDAYAEALEGIEYQNMMGISTPIYYGNIKNDFVGGYIFDVNTERLLIDYIKRGDYMSAEKIINDVFDSITANVGISHDYVKCLMFDIAASMLKIPSELKSTREEIVKIFDPYRILSSCDNIIEMKKHVLASVKEICKILVAEQAPISSRLIEQISTYVYEHFCESDLNVSKIGAAFGMSPSYLSKQFRDGGGNSLVSFINKQRIEKAKVLLKDTSLSAAEISEQVGFANVRTFNRVFKNFEGVSPGKMR